MSIVFCKKSHIFAEIITDFCDILDKQTVLYRTLVHSRPWCFRSRQSILSGMRFTLSNHKFTPDSQVGGDLIDYLF